MRIYLLVDFGSTFTKVTAVDLDSETVLGGAQSPTTVDTDITIGLENALSQLPAECPRRPEDYHGSYACSSAAGGLKIAAIGLVPELTLKAAQMAALGAGAKILFAHGFEIDEEIINEIESKLCDIVLLCGGTDGGNKKVIIHNAEMLAKSDLSCPILVCGNRSANSEIRSILESGNKSIYTASNVLPAVDRIDAEPAQALIREIFISHIIKAKGLDKAKTLFSKDIIPTPKSTLHAAALLADGSKSEPGIGSLLVVEVGGATTNMHSVESIKPVVKNAVVRGLPEAKVKRTVEGDMGIRFNARTIYESVGYDVLIEQAIALDSSYSAEIAEPDSYTSFLSENVEHIPKNKEETLLDASLAKSAVKIAAERHAGYMKTEYTATGEVTVQYGKNLLEVKNILGTGGIFKYGVCPEAILESAMFSDETPWSLRPKAAKTYIDSGYLMYAIGLLSQDFPDEALRIAKKYLRSC